MPEALDTAREEIAYCNSEAKHLLLVLLAFPPLNPALLPMDYRCMFACVCISVAAYANVIQWKF